MFEGLIQNPLKSARGLGSEKGDTRKVNLVLTPTRPSSPLGAQRGVNPHHLLTSMKASSLVMASKKSSLPEQQIPRKESGAAALSPADSAHSKSQERDRVWGSHPGCSLGAGNNPSLNPLWLCPGMHLHKEPVKSRSSALQNHLTLGSSVTSRIVALPL